MATHILAFEGDSRVVWFDGNYSEYEEDKRKRLGAEADQPHRIRYRQMTRHVAKAWTVRSALNVGVTAQCNEREYRSHGDAQ